MSEGLNLDIAAARHVLGIATPEETDALNNGAAGDGAVPDVDQLCAPLPSEDQAVWTLLEHHISAIAHGRVEPEEGTRLVIDEVFRPTRLSPKSRSRLGDSHDIDRLIALQDDYDDMRRYERRTNTPDRRQAQVDAQVTFEAKQWMTRNATGRVL
ncbi:MAG TPA: hypothetical protein VLA05_10800 [Coriobacteriia bacterium]|nr:hypothetical protein [Coriobacteriia bacterium]